MSFYPSHREKPFGPAAGRPVVRAEEWPGRNRGAKQRLWERLNPRHRKALRLLARALVAEQSRARLEDSTSGEVSRLRADIELLANRPARLLAEVARRARPPA